MIRVPATQLFSSNNNSHALRASARNGRLQDYPTMQREALLTAGEGYCRHTKCSNISRGVERRPNILSGFAGQWGLHWRKHAVRRSGLPVSIGSARWRKYRHGEDVLQDEA